MHPFPNSPFHAGTEQVGLYSTDTMDIVHDRRLNMLHAIWKGYQSVAAIQDGCERLLEAMVEHATYRILYDQSRVVGIWRVAAVWLATDWFPRMQQAGLSHFAWVDSAAKLSQLSTDLTLSLLRPDSFSIQVFPDADTATAWLRRSSHGAALTERRSLRALVVEDNPKFAELFCDMLRVARCDAVAVPSAQAGLALIERDVPDIIFCDLGLPDAMDGFGFVRSIRADPRLASIPVIAVSGYVSEENRQRAVYAGFDQVCAKPVRFKEISDIVVAFARQAAVR